MMDLLLRHILIEMKFRLHIFFFPVFWTSPPKTVWLLSSRNEGAHQKQKPPTIFLCTPVWSVRYTERAEFLYLSIYIFLPLASEENQCNLLTFEMLFSHIIYRLWRVALSALKVSNNWGDECLQPLKQLLLNLRVLLTLTLTLTLDSVVSCLSLTLGG